MCAVIFNSHPFAFRCFNGAVQNNGTFVEFRNIGKNKEQETQMQKKNNKYKQIIVEYVKLPDRRK